MDPQQQLLAGINAVRNAFSAMYSPAADNRVVKINEAIIQEFKNSLSADAAVASARIFLQPILQDQQIQGYEVLYALQLISERILQIPPWSSHSQDVRSSLRNLAVQLVMHTNPARYGHMVQEKAAYFLVSLAVREWPQAWPTFLDDLLAGALPSQMVCIVLRLLSEETHEFGANIASTRKTELRLTMASGVPAMLPFIVKSVDSFANSNDAAGMRAAIAVIEAFMVWVPIEDLFQARIPNACIKLLNIPQYAPGALSAIQALLKRKDAKTEASIQMSYRKEIFPAIVTYAVANFKSIQSLSYAPPSGVIPESIEAFKIYSFHQNAASMQEIDSELHEYTVKFVTMLAKLGSSCFIPSFVFVNKEHPLEAVEQQTAMAYIDIMLSAIASPSLPIRVSGISFFTALFASLHRTLHRHATQAKINSALAKTTRSNGISRQGANVPKPVVKLGGELSLIMEGMKTQFVHTLFVDLVKRFVNTASLALIRWPKDPLLQAYADEDFVSDNAALNSQWNVFKTRAAQNISLATKLEPVAIMNVVLDRLVDLLNKANAINWSQQGQAAQQNGAPVANGKYPFVSGFVALEDSVRTWMFGNFNATHSKSMVAALDGAVLSSEAVLAMLTSLNFFENNESAQKPVQDLFTTIIGLTEKDMQAAKVSSLRMFIPLYKTNKSALEMCLRCLVEIIENSKQSTLCFRACTSLSSICRRLLRSKSPVLKEFLGPLKDFAIRTQADEGYAPIERNLILDSAVSASLIPNDVAEQAPVVEALINPLMGALDTTGLTAKIGNPRDLLEFCENGQHRDMALATFMNMESAMSQIVRANRVRVGLDAIRTSLTQSIAPKTVTFAAHLVRTLHAMYNPNKFPVAEKKIKSILEPTSREIAYLLNLSDGTNQASWLNPVSGNSLGNTGTDGGDTSTGEQEVKTSLERADDLLAKLDIQVPDPQWGTIRENVKRMRMHGYELLRCSILSGVSVSVPYLVDLLKAICSDMQYLEPIHVQYVLSRVVRPLLCNQVSQAEPSYLNIVANSELPQFIDLVRNMVQKSTAENTDASSSSKLFALEVAREHGRKLLAKTAAELVSSIFPRDVRKKESGFVPIVFSLPLLNQALNSLWEVLCSPEIGLTDNGASRLALNLVSRGVEMAPVSAQTLYSGKLVLILETAFRTDGMGSDSSNDAALHAISSYFRKWPSESSNVVMGMIAGLADDFKGNIAEKLRELIESINVNGVSVTRKGTRSKLRAIIRTLATKAGVSARKEVVVGNLPKAPARVARKNTKNGEKNEDMILPDGILDSLYGGGDPL